MKKILAVLLILSMMLTLIACTKKDKDEGGEEPDITDVGNTDGENTGDGDNVGENTGDDKEEIPAFDFLGNDLTEYIKLGNYKGLEATLESDVLTDEEFDAYVNDNILSYFEDKEHITDRAVEEGDTVVINYQGSVDGEGFSGGTATDVELIAADGNGYIPGFASGIIGHMPGESFVIDIAFPDPYPNNTELSGKPVQFAIMLQYIVGDDIVSMTIDDLTNEFVQENFRFATVEEFIASEREALEMNKQYSVKQMMYSELWQKIVESSEVIKYPETELQRRDAEQMDYYKGYAEYNEMELDAFLEENGLTEESIREESESIVKEDLVMYSLIKELDAEVSDEEVAETTQFFADMYGVTSEEMVAYFGEEQFKMTAQFDKVMALVAELGNITEAAE